MTTKDGTIHLKFAVPPQEYMVRRWSENCLGEVDAVSEDVEIKNNEIVLEDGGSIYEVVAKWTVENLAAEGTVHYGFYVIKTTLR